MFGKAKTASARSKLYATSTDFCRIFENDMGRLYSLSLLLTGNRAAAEKCFVQGLSDSKASNPVFKEWAESWARRTIVQNAIRIIEPRPSDYLTSKQAADFDPALPPQMAAILELPTFDRFAYVLSVLEGYPLQECALLLDCSRGEVVAARMRALQEVVRSTQRRGQIEHIELKGDAPREDGRFDGLSHLAATA